MKLPIRSLSLSCALLLALLPVTLRAQEQAALGALGALDGRASPTLRAQMTALTDSVARAGLPVSPLIDKALEGVSKGADDRRIMTAARGVAADLGVARRALGPASDAELVSAVAALRAGAGVDGLVQIRRTLRGRSLVVPLSVLASALVDGVPAGSAVAVVSASATRETDATLLAYGRAMSHDIASGVAPVVALTSSFGGTMRTTSLRPGALPAPVPTPPKPRP